MYFDTLKVSSLEQTAEETSARGGIGNPNLITWDFGKEITVSLEDALYAPASQSLMWGGKFGLGKTKIKGFWNPYYYKNNESGWVYKYTDEFLGYGDNDNKKSIIYEYKEKKEEEPVKYGCNLFLPATEYSPKQGQPAEKAILIVNNFGSFRFSEKRINTDKDEDGRYLLTTINNTDSFPFSSWNNRFTYINAMNNILFDYEWLDCDIQMLSQQGNQDIYYAEHVDILIRTDVENLSNKILIKHHNDNSYYNSQIDFYKTLNYKAEETTTPVKVKIGTFYINDDFNYNITTQDSIYSIETGIDDVPYLDRMEKCIAKQTFCINTDQNTVLNCYKDLPQYKHSKLTVYIDPKTMKAYEPNANSFQRKNGAIINGNLRVIKSHETYYKWTRSEAPKNTTLGHQIIVDAKHFPGTFRLVGETLSRRRADGKDERYQFEIPLCKLASGTNLTLQANGDPTTFTMELKVLQRSDGVMIKLTQYDVEDAIYDGQISGSKKIIPQSAGYQNNSCTTCEDPIITIQKSEDTSYEIILPYQDGYYCVPIDCLSPFTDGQAYLMLPKTLEDAQSIYEEYEQALNTGDYSELEKYRNILLVKANSGSAKILINDQIYKVIGNSSTLNKNDFLIESSQGAQLIITLGGGD